MASSRTVDFWRILTDIFDVYLKILRRVKQMVDKELGRLSDNYRFQHSCPLCQYEVSSALGLVFRG